jgi:hypothetical protein
VHDNIQGEDVATVILAMDQGQVTVNVNMAYAQTPLERECFPETLLFIEGDAGSVEVSPGCRIRLTTRAETSLRTAKPPKNDWADPDYAVVQSSMVPCLEHLLNAIRDGRPSETEGSEYLKTMQLVFAAYESAESGCAIRLT